MKTEELKKLETEVVEFSKTLRTLRVVRVEAVFTTGTHPFVIGPAHVTFASDYRGGILGEEAITASGVGCEMQERHGKCRLRLDHPTHQSTVAAMIEFCEKVAEKEVMKELKEISAKFEIRGLEGFGFLNPEQIIRSEQNDAEKTG